MGTSLDSACFRQLVACNFTKRDGKTHLKVFVSSSQRCTNNSNATITNSVAICIAHGLDNSGIAIFKAVPVGIANLTAIKPDVLATVPLLFYVRQSILYEVSDVTLVRSCIHRIPVEVYSQTMSHSFKLSHGIRGVTTTRDAPNAVVNVTDDTATSGLTSRECSCYAFPPLNQVAFVAKDSLTRSLIRDKLLHDIEISICKCRYKSTVRSKMNRGRGQGAGS